MFGIELHPDGSIWNNPPVSSDYYQVIPDINTETGVNITHYIGDIDQNTPMEEIPICVLETARQIAESVFAYTTTTIGVKTGFPDYRRFHSYGWDGESFVIMEKWDCNSKESGHQIGLTFSGDTARKLLEIEKSDNFRFQWYIRDYLNPKGTRESLSL